MNKPTEVYQPHADHEESIERIVKHLGRNKLRRRVFDLIYGRGNKPKTVAQIIEQLRLKPHQRQSARNQINYLAKHKIISTFPIKPSENNGNRFAFGKRDFVMANKEEILRKNERPELLKSTPTKRRPELSGIANVANRVRMVLARQKGPRASLRVLYLQANPTSQHRLRTDAEFRMVQEAVRGSKYRDHIKLVSAPAADAKSVLDGINDQRPQIIHFSGHGGGGSIWLDDGKVNKSIGRAMNFDLLADALKATSSPPTLLVLNACDTLQGAGVLLDAAKVVIGMSDSVSDFGAATFAAQFYAAIASAQPISVALEQGILAM